MNQSSTVFTTDFCFQIDTTCNIYKLRFRNLIELII
jgi:hypothetical protein